MDPFLKSIVSRLVGSRLLFKYNKHLQEEKQLSESILSTKCLIAAMEDAVENVSNLRMPQHILTALQPQRYISPNLPPTNFSVSSEDRKIKASCLSLDSSITIQPHLDILEDWESKHLIACEKRINLEKQLVIAEKSHHSKVRRNTQASQSQSHYDTDAEQVYKGFFLHAAAAAPSPTAIC
ncbi:hypothetical protein DXG01_000492 [Tephrocybe rancida]|nr:hypothetical protein DXG01_000492 [Tephrocybe rancida]